MAVNNTCAVRPQTHSDPYLFTFKAVYRAMPFERSPGLKKASERWHKNRIRARRTGFNLNDFSDEEIVKYDLDTARITGSDNPRSFRLNPDIDILDVGGIDVRTLHNR